MMTQPVESTTQLKQYSENQMCTAPSYFLWLNEIGFQREPLHLQWMKSGTGLWTLKDAASKSRQISTLSPAMRRTAALFSSSKTCLWREAHSSSMKSSRREETKNDSVSSSCITAGYVFQESGLTNKKGGIGFGFEIWDVEPLDHIGVCRRAGKPPRIIWDLRSIAQVSKIT